MTPRVLRYTLEAARRHGVTSIQIHSPDRSREVCFARWEIMRRLRHDGLTLAQIGRALKRDHSTVIHGLQAIGPGLWFA